jgi:hypothetical protein
MFCRTFSSDANRCKKVLHRQSLTEERGLKARREDVGLGRPQAEGPVRSEQFQGKVCGVTSTSILPGNARVVDLAIAHASRSKGIPKPAAKTSLTRPVHRIDSETSLPENCRFPDLECNGECNARVTHDALQTRNATFR